MTPTPAIFLVAQDRNFRHALRQTLYGLGPQVVEYRSVAECEDAIAARERQSNRLDEVPAVCIVLGPQVKDGDGNTRLAQLPRRDIMLQAVVVSDVADMQIVAFHEGEPSVQWLPSSAGADEICDAVRKALNKLSTSVMQEVERRDAETRFQTLSPREREVMELLAFGKTPKMIATSLGTSHNTVRVQRAAVMRKMNVTNMAELANAFRLLELES